MKSIFNKKDYRDYLVEELESRCHKNSKYSLRAFARDLALKPSKLSEVLNHKQGLSRTCAKEIAHKLGFNLLEEEYFCDLVMLKHGRSKREKQAAEMRLNKIWQKEKNENSPSQSNNVLLLDGVSQEKMYEIIRQIKKILDFAEIKDVWEPNQTDECQLVIRFRVDLK